MSEKAKRLAVKDLDPKARGKNVKGGVFCLVFLPVTIAGRAVEKVRKTLNPR